MLSELRVTHRVFSSTEEDDVRGATQPEPAAEVACQCEGAQQRPPHGNDVSALCNHMWSWRRIECFMLIFQ